MKTTNFVIMSLLFIAIVGLNSCKDDDKCISGMGNIVTEEINLAGFHSISTSGEFTITIEQADEQKVEVISHQNIIDELKRDIIDSTWNIELRDNKCYKNTDITVRIYIPYVREIETSGTIDLVLNSFENLENLDINCSGTALIFQSGVLNIANRFSLNSSGAADLVANFNSKEVDIDVSGTLDAKLTGSTESMTIDISGTGNIDAFDMIAESCEITVSGVGDLEVSVENVLDITISGTGTVRYKGMPVITTDISGVGEVIDAN